MLIPIFIPTSLTVKPGFPHLPDIDEAIRTLYERMSRSVVQARPWSLPVLVVGTGEEPVRRAQRVVDAAVRYLEMDGVRLTVSYDRSLPAEVATVVELGAGPEYPVRLGLRWRDDNGLTAVLAHAAVRVFLHRAGIRFTEPGRNELLVDTAAAYLGVGWPRLNAYRVGPRNDFVRYFRLVHRELLGCLTPAELGYVLAKRTFAYGDDIEPQLRGNPHAWHAYQAGWRRASTDLHRPPFTAAGRKDAAVYAKDKKRAQSGRIPKPTQHRYRFEPTDPMSVVFPCPTCTQHLRIPIGRNLSARCPLCHATVDCSS